MKLESVFRQPSMTMNDFFGYRPYTVKSPLNYPGSKFRGAKHILPYFPKGMTELVSPFFGAGHIELKLAVSGVKIYGSDLYWDLVNFWTCLQSSPSDCECLAMSYYPMTPDRLDRIWYSYKDLSNKHKAVVFWIVHKATFGSLGFAGVCRLNTKSNCFNYNSIKKLGQFYNPNIEVTHKDYENALLSNPETFAYCDPPYMLKKPDADLYGYKGEIHKTFSHERLFSVLDKRKNWILSYNNCPEVRDMYKDYRQEFPVWSNTLNPKSETTEILIINTGE